MEREGAPLSPDCVPALDIVLRAEARSVNGLEASQVGMNTVAVLDERGNAVNLFRARPRHGFGGTAMVCRYCFEYLTDLVEEKNSNGPRRQGCPNVGNRRE
jgi:hypothetical protein